MTIRLSALVPILLVAGLVLPAAAHAHPTDTVTVSLTVETHVTDRAGLAPADLPDPVPGTASCDVEVPHGADGTVLLDEATQDDCISGWEGQDTSQGTFVTAIDGWQAPGLTCLAFGAGVCDWWEHNVNGESAGYGADGYTAEDGDHVRWLYRNTI